MTCWRSLTNMQDDGAMSGKRGSNPRPLAWEANALPTELLPHNEIKLTLFNFLFQTVFKR